MPVSGSTWTNQLWYKSQLLVAKARPSVATERNNLAIRNAGKPTTAASAAPSTVTKRGGR